MSLVIHNDKHHLNYKIAIDNLQLIRHIRNNRLGLVNHTAVLIGSNLIIRSNYK